MKARPPLFDRWISAPARRGAPAGLAALLILAAFGAAALDGAVGEFLSQGQWRSLAIAPAVILYILVVAPLLARVDAQVQRALRPLVLVDDAAFERLVERTAYVKPIGELIALAAGAAIAILLAVSQISQAPPHSWRAAYYILTTCVMYALLGLTIYSSVAATRLTAALHRQPMQINVLDTTGFEAIGRQSLALALVFIGGIMLSLALSASRPEIFASREFWLIYLPLSAVPVAVFFLNMLPTHRVLAAAKRKEIAAVQRHIASGLQQIMQRLDDGQSAGGAPPAEMTVLIAYEQRLREARTWPYNTAMLRTLFFSVLLPIGTTLLQRLWSRLFL